MLAIACVVLTCSLNSLAADRKTLANLPPEAQASIRAALLRDSATPGLTINNYTLTASDGVNYADFGASVAIDGNTVVVGAIQFNAPGAVYVFTKPTNGWANMTQTAELTASDGQIGDQLGCSVGISGNTIVAGACDATVNGNQSEGAAYVFVEPTGGWRNATETAKLTASDAGSYAGFGVGTAISGNTVVAGAVYGTIQNEAPGQAYIFVKPESGWSDMTQTAELTPSDGATNDYFGSAVAIEGNTAVVTECECSGGSPYGAYVFVEPTGGWTNMNETAKLTPSDGGPTNAFGVSASINGRTIVIGDSIHGFEKGGAVYVFVEPTGGWVTMTQNAILDVSPNKLGCLGESVSISGNVVLAGDSCSSGDTGAVYVFLEPPSGWQNSSHFALRLSVHFAYNRDYFGGSVAISGTTGIIGADWAPTSPPCRDGNCMHGPGEAFIFTAQ